MVLDESGRGVSTAGAYGEALLNTESSVLSTIFVQAQDSMGNHADHNRDTFILELTNNDTGFAETYISQAFSNSLGAYHSMKIHVVQLSTSNYSSFLSSFFMLLVFLCCS